MQNGQILSPHSAQPNVRALTLKSKVTNGRKVFAIGGDARGCWTRRWRDLVELHASDRYAGEWPRERFRLCGVAYDLSEKVKSDIYRDVLPLLNSRKVQLLDDRRLISQLHGLERRTARGGKDSIDHSPGGHDDVANSVAGALLLAGVAKPLIISDAVLAWSQQPAHRGAVYMPAVCEAAPRQPSKYDPPADTAGMLYTTLGGHAN